ncbi:MAG: glucose-1-phosphate adenylyltransferase [Candidatus Hydrogenedentota bacterium]
MSTHGLDFGSIHEMEKVGAIVLGGGRGTRLYPLTIERAKPAVPLGGRYRLIDIPLSNCIHSRINRIYVMTQFNSTSLNRHVNNSYKFDSFSGGFVEILAAEQTPEGADWYQGTADAVRKHLKHIMNLNAGHFLILSGDQLYRMDYRTLVDTHLRNNADITVSTLPVKEEAASAYGIMKVREDGRIDEFVEKPRPGQELAAMASPISVFERYGLSIEQGEYLASMGVYVIKREVLEDILRKREDWTDFGAHIIPNALNTRRVIAHLFSDFWEDIGTVRSYYDVSMRLLEPDPPFEFHDPNHLIFTRARYLPGSRVRAASITDSFVCEGTRLSGAKINKSIVGIRSVLQENSELERTILMGADYYTEETRSEEPIPIGIGENSRISGAIVDKNARIGKNVFIEGNTNTRDRKGPGFVVRGGIVVVLKNAVIPDDTEIR